MSYKTGKVHFCLLGTNGNHVKAKNERFTRVVFRTSNMRISSRHLAEINGRASATMSWFFTSAKFISFSCLGQRAVFNRVILLCIQNGL